MTFPEKLRNKITKILRRKLFVNIEEELLYCQGESIEDLDGKINHESVIMASEVSTWDIDSESSEKYYEEIRTILGKNPRPSDLENIIENERSDQGKKRKYIIDTAVMLQDGVQIVKIEQTDRLNKVENHPRYQLESDALSDLEVADDFVSKKIQ